MLYVGLDYHKRHAQVNAIDEKGSDPCLRTPRPDGQDIAEESWHSTSWNPKGKETQDSKKARMTPAPHRRRAPATTAATTPAFAQIELALSPKSFHFTTRARQAYH